MKAMVCEMCQSNDLVKQDGMYVCQHCGTKYDPEEAKKLMVEVSGSVTIDNSSKIENYYKLARQAKENQNSEDAAKYYDLIRQEIPNDWEANFFSVYYTTMQCKIGEIPNASYTLKKSIKSVVEQVKENLSDERDQVEALTEIVGKCQSIVLTLYAGVWKQYQPDGYYNNPDYFAQKTVSVLGILTTLGDSIENTFGTKGCFETIVMEVRKCDVIARVNQLKTQKKLAYDEITLTIIEKIKSVDPEYSAPALFSQTSTSGGCYVATAVYGSYDCPEVWTLRRFRDYTLAETWYGRAFIRTYYAISPTLVKWFGHCKWFKNIWKPTLDKMVEKLNNNGVDNTPYNDRNW